MISIKKSCKYHTFQNSRPIQISKFLANFHKIFKIGNSSKEKNKEFWHQSDWWKKAFFSISIFGYVEIFFFFKKSLFLLVQQNVRRKVKRILVKLNFPFLKVFTMLSLADLLKKFECESFIMNFIELYFFLKKYFFFTCSILLIVILLFTVLHA